MVSPLGFPNILQEKRSFHQILFPTECLVRALSRDWFYLRHWTLLFFLVAEAFPQCWKTSRKLVLALSSWFLCCIYPRPKPISVQYLQPHQKRGAFTAPRQNRRKLTFSLRKCLANPFSSPEATRPVGCNVKPKGITFSGATYWLSSAFCLSSFPISFAVQN